MHRPPFFMNAVPKAQPICYVTVMKKILVADIGGTNARFMAFETDGHLLYPKQKTSIPTTGSNSFTALMEKLTASPFSLPPFRADFLSIAIAGPVQGKTYCDPPNIAWDVDISDYAQHTGLSHYLLINDFSAQAFACGTSVFDEAATILAGTAQQDGVIAVIGAGTGLGKAILAPDGRGGYFALPTEGGHGLFPFIGEHEFEFQRFIMKNTGKRQVIWENVVSGPGLSLIHAFLTGEHLKPPEVAAQFNSGSETLQWAARFYARACRDFALSTLATGGVVISGGVAAKNPELIMNETFRKEFRTSETHARLLQDIPVKLNTNEDSGLWGAAYAAFNEISRW